MKRFSYFLVWALLGLSVGIAVAVSPKVSTPAPQVDSYLGIGVEYNPDGSYQGAAIIGRASTEYQCEIGNRMVIAKTHFPPGHFAATMCIPVLKGIATGPNKEVVSKPADNQEAT